MEDSINLQELFNNGKIELEDFTVYSVIDIFDEEVYKLEFDDYIARWINKSDIDIEPNNIINDDEYIFMLFPENLPARDVLLLESLSYENKSNNR